MVTQPYAEREREILVNYSDKCNLILHFSSFWMGFKKIPMSVLCTDSFPELFPCVPVAHQCLAPVRVEEVVKCPVRLELESVLYHLWLLGIEPGSSGRQASALNY